MTGAPVVNEPHISRAPTVYLVLDWAVQQRNKSLPVTKTAHSRQLYSKQENQSRQE
jgi:hypothetical protein